MVSITRGSDVREKAERWLLVLIDPHDFTRQCISDLLRHNASDLMVKEVAAINELEPGDADCCRAVLMRLDAPHHFDQRMQAALARLDAAMPGVPVAVLCGLADMEAALAFVRHGVKACLPPTLSVDQVIAALRLVMAGGVYIGPTDAPVAATEASALALPLAERLRPLATTVLTPRELEVLAHLQQGKPNKVIAYELGMSENTVKVHVGRILKKLNAMNRTALACGTSLPAAGQVPGGDWGARF